MNREQHTKSIWSKNFQPPSLNRFSGERRVDVAIVGAGITGMTAAALLAHAGRNVIVLERSRFGSHGTTHRTSAHLTAVLDQSFSMLIRKFDEQAVRQAVNASRAAIDRIEQFSQEYTFDNEFARVDGYYYTELDHNSQEVEDDCQSARRVGLSAQLIDDVPLPFRIARGYRVPNQAQFHPLKHVAGLAEFVNGAGPDARVFDQSHVREIKGEGPFRLVLDGGVVIADEVILATHTPIGVWATIQMRLTPYRSYCLTARTREPIEPGLYWDTADPYHYTRLLSLEDPHTIIVGGADTKTGCDCDTHKSFAQLENYTHTHFPVESIDTEWSAQFFEPADGLPYIGKAPGREHVYIATGYSGTGLTYGTAAGMLISDLILKRPNPWAETFSPGRLKPIASAKRIIEEAGVSIQGLILDRLFKAAPRSVEALNPGEGRILSINGQRIAAYRDMQGNLSAVSPNCTHMGCMIEWNSSERQWDCKCHGSAFSPDGEVIDGPATRPLQMRQVERAEQPGEQEQSQPPIGSRASAATPRR